MRKPNLWEIRNSVISFLFDLLGREPVSNSRHWILSVLGRNALRPFPITEAEVSSLALFGSSLSTIVSPCQLNEVSKPVTGCHQELRAYIFKGATATAYSSGIIFDGKLVLPDEVIRSKGRARTDTGGLFRYDSAHCIGRKASFNSVPSGILIGGAGASNWYHFIVECLPKARLAHYLPAEYDGFPLLVPDECRLITNYSQALSLLSKGREIKYLSKGEYLYVENLISFTEVSYSPYNLEIGCWLEVSDFSQHDYFLRNYVEFLNANINCEPSIGSPSRIFLVRTNGRRNYNQSELIKIADRYGFTPCDPGAISLSDQAKLFAGAGIIVGASGAAWVGLLFCRSPVRLLSFVPKEFNEFCSFSSLAALLGHRMEFITSSSTVPLRSSGEGNVSDYFVDPAVFESALRQLTGDFH